jgi:Mn-dependent DtxR family transcriptional regulator
LVEGGQIDFANCKKPISELRELGLVETQPFRGGGCWLTSEGRRIAKRLSE